MEQIAANYPQIEAAYETAKEFLENPANQEFIEERRKFQMVQRAITNTNLEEGLEKGREEGEEIGLIEGQTKQSISMLLRIIGSFLGKPSDGLRSRIENLTDFNQINRLFGMVANSDVRSLEELEQNLR
ncbi:MAG: hypothetical protein Q4G69_01525 [Planctomycetia bacterium]|nr:hypothetical protein [Planctomycetia bacterium]